MAVIVPSEGRRRDWPQIEVAQVASAAAGSAADVTTQVCALPDLTLTDLPNGLNETISGMIPLNAMRVRHAAWINNAANRAGNATNNFDFNLRVYRAGVLQGVLAYYTQSISTTVAAAVSATGVQAVTPAAMTGIMPGTALYIDSGGTPELVYVISVGATTFTANFTKTHSSSFTVTSALLQNRQVAFVLAKAIPAGAFTGTLPTISSTGSQAVTPNTVNGLSGMYGIHNGDYLRVDAGVANKDEVVQVTAVSATQFTATFANTHSSGATVASAGNPNSPGGSTAYNQGTG